MPGSPLALIGFSLGGNIVLKLAGEAADRPVPGAGARRRRRPAHRPGTLLRPDGLPRNRLYERYFATAAWSAQARTATSALPRPAAGALPAPG